MVGHGESSAGLYLADPTSPIPSHCASIVVISTLRVKMGHENTTTPTCGTVGAVVSSLTVYTGDPGSSPTLGVKIVRIWTWNGGPHLLQYPEVTVASVYRHAQTFTWYMKIEREPTRRGVVHITEWTDRLNLRGSTVEIATEKNDVARFSFFHKINIDITVFLEMLALKVLNFWTFT